MHNFENEQQENFFTNFPKSSFYENPYIEEYNKYKKYIENLKSQIDDIKELIDYNLQFPIFINSENDAESQNLLYKHYFRKMILNFFNLCEIYFDNLNYYEIELRLLKSSLDFYEEIIWVHNHIERSLIESRKIFYSLFKKLNEESKKYIASQINKKFNQLETQIEENKKNIFYTLKKDFTVENYNFESNQKNQKIEINNSESEFYSKNEEKKINIKSDVENIIIDDQNQDLKNYKTKSLKEEIKENQNLLNNFFLLSKKFCKETTYTLNPFYFDDDQNKNQDSEQPEKEFVLFNSFDNKYTTPDF